MSSQKLSRFSFALFIFFLLVASVSLSLRVPVQWDEGWSLSVARNWVELGHYGRTLGNHVIDVGLAASLPVVAPVAVAFKVFGVGLWQARLSPFVFLVGTFFVFFLLSSRLYNRKVATVAVVFLAFIGTHEYTNILVLGSQVMGEVPMLFFLLLGYFCLSGRRITFFHAMSAVIFWNLALIAKAQLMPFFLAGIIVPFVACIHGKQLKQIATFALFAFTIVVSFFVIRFYHPIFLSALANESLPQMSLPQVSTEDYYEVFVFVRDLSVRAESWGIVLKYALVPLVVYLLYGRRLLKEVFTSDALRKEYSLSLIKLSLFTVGASWLLWFVTLAMPWPRYLAIPILLSSIFAAALVDKWYGPNIVSNIFSQLFLLLDKKQRSAKNFAALLVIVLFLSIVFASSQRVFFIANSFSNKPLLEVTSYLNSTTPANSLIETYDSELLFLLDRPYHYPPDPVHMQLNRKVFLKQDVSIDYDPLSANPDFLVIGPWQTVWNLYSGVIDSQQFKLEKNVSGYKVYKRNLLLE